MPLALPSKPLLASSLREATFKSWRAVEGQHVVSTLRLTGNNPERQQLLELILEESKPPLPDPAIPLHYLLSTPFRYPPSPHGSRFRAWPDPGVLYSAAHRRTACAELGYWRWRFVSDSTGLTGIPASAQTLFQLGAKGQGHDLTLPPLHRWRSLWSSPDSYQPTQSLARRARAVQSEWLAYQSVRDPEHGKCFAILSPSAIRPSQPLARETWYLTVTTTSAIWQRDREGWVFPFQG